LLKRKIHSVKSIVASLIVVASFFCVLFGEGLHFHDFDIHIGDHFDVHAHVHAHESHDDKPFQPDSEQDDHKHKVSMASDIIGTLTTPPQVKPDLKNDLIFSSDTRVSTIHLEFDDTPTLFDLPPPRSVTDPYHLFSFSYRGPPIA
jgi:hypothetical protein